MPTYEYLCNTCSEKFETEMTLAEKSAGKKPSCPKCKSKEVAQILGNVNVVGSKRESSTPPPSCGPSCPTCPKY